MNQDDFIPQLVIQFKEPQTKFSASVTCKSCMHRQRWRPGSQAVFQYCAVRKSARTHNGLLKIKCKTPACQHYVPDV